MRISDWSSDVCSSDLGLGEVAGLAAELVRLRAADGDGDRRRRWRREADRTVAYRRLGIEPNVVVDRGEKQRRELVDAADGDAALDQIARLAAHEGRPVGRQHHRGQVAARGIAGDVKTIRVAAIIRSMVVEPAAEIGKA